MKSNTPTIRPNTQNFDVLQYLYEHGAITDRDAYILGIRRLSARIKDLRNAGYPIKTTNKTTRNRHGHTTNYASYSLMENADA